jgi:hypothetical protein
MDRALLAALILIGISLVLLAACICPQPENSPAQWFRVLA